MGHGNTYLWHGGHYGEHAYLELDEQSHGPFQPGDLRVNRFLLPRSLYHEPVQALQRAARPLQARNETADVLLHLRLLPACDSLHRLAALLVEPAHDLLKGAQTGGASNAPIVQACTRLSHDAETWGAQCHCKCARTRPERSSGGGGGSSRTWARIPSIRG